MKRIRLLAAAAALSLGASMLAMAATAIPAAAVTVPPPGGGGYLLQNGNSNLCLGILDGADDAPAVQWPCVANAANQQWQVGSELGATGYYQLINGDNQCLGIYAGSTTQGARAYGWTCVPNAPNQYWYAWSFDCEDPYTTATVFYNYGSGMVLGVLDNSTAQGAAVVQWPYVGTSLGTNNQFWFTNLTTTEC
jgi:hypothetical protein